MDGAAAGRWDPLRLGHRIGLSPRLARRLEPYAYLAPLVLLLAVFVYGPLLYTLGLSLVQWNLVSSEKVFAGVSNYVGLFRSTLFRDALVNTAIYGLGAIPLKALLPLPVAVFIWSIGGRMGFLYKTVLFLPTLLSFVVVSILWLWILNPIVGFAKTLLATVGGTMPNLLADGTTALWTILGISAWKVMGFNVLLYLAGLSTVDRTQMEAMRLDGAGDWAILRHLIWPMLTPTTLFVALNTVIFTVQQVFTPIDIMTRGGPSNGTVNLFYMVYEYVFSTFNVGYGAAGTVVIFVLLLAVTLAKLRLFERRVVYER
jgi:multiple sugar transport system permease protein/sn-glycerol 3-phosphate transport system permease protein